MKMSNTTQARVIFTIFLAALGFIFFPMFSGKLSVHSEDDIAYPETSPNITLERVGKASLECENKDPN